MDIGKIWQNSCTSNCMNAHFMPLITAFALLAAFCSEGWVQETHTSTNPSIGSFFEDKTTQTYIPINANPRMTFTF